MDTCSPEEIHHLIAMNAKDEEERFKLAAIYCANSDLVEGMDARFVFPCLRFAANIEGESFAPPGVCSLPSDVCE